MVMILICECWPTVAMRCCLPLDTTPVNPNLLDPQMVSWKLLPKPLNQIAGTSAKDFQELLSQDTNEGDDFAENDLILLGSILALPMLLPSGLPMPMLLSTQPITLAPP